MYLPFTTLVVIYVSNAAGMFYGHPRSGGVPYASTKVQDVVYQSGNPYNNHRPSPIVNERIISESSLEFNSQPVNFLGMFASSPAARGESAHQSYQQHTIDPSIATFVSTFSEAVYSSKILLDLFDLSDSTLSAYSKYLYGFACKIMLQFGFPLTHAHVTAYYASRAIEDLDALTLPLIVGFFANSVAKYLFAEGVLDSDCAGSLALAFAEEMETAVKLCSRKDSQCSRFSPLGIGYKGFLSSLDLFRSEKLTDIAFYFGTEVIIAVNKCAQKPGFPPSN